MQYSILGKTNVKVSRIALGGMSFGTEPWMVPRELSQKIIRKAMDLGINFIDTADVYSDGESERIIGESISGYREELVIATKVGLEFGTGINSAGLSRKRLYSQLRGSLERLKTNYIDIYQLHRWDYNTDALEVLSTITDFVRNGSVRYFGATSLYSFQIQKLYDLAIYNGLERITYYSPRYNLAYREEEREGIPVCRELGIAIAPYSPLARGFLSGKYKRNERPDTVRYRTDKYFPQGYFRAEDFDVLDALENVAREKGLKPSQVALAWLFSKPWITAVLLGVTKLEHLDDAVEALDIKLEKYEVETLEKQYKPHEQHGPTKSPLA
ncbi:MAG: aldo/keto reductase [Conexivisphaerales archaeon]